MITLALFEKMAADGVADLIKNENFFWEEMPLQRDGKPAAGVWLITRSGDAAASPKGLNLKTTVDIYVATANKVETEATHQQILEWLIVNPSICYLHGTIGGRNYAFENIRIRPASTPENAGATTNGLIVKIASATLTYDLSI